MASDVDVSVGKDNAKEVSDGIKNAIEKALEAVGLAAEGYAKLKCPVDTGNLRNSITHVTDDNSVYIGTNVEYGPAVELGTWKRAPQEFLRPAAEDHTTEYRNIFESQFKK